MNRVDSHTSGVRTRRGIESSQQHCSRGAGRDGIYRSGSQGRHIKNRFKTLDLTREATVK